MSDIFLSYKSEDKAKAQTIARALEKKGYSVWWDRGIRPGRRFSKVIQKELDAAKCVVVLWSKESIESKWVETEASEGDNRGILIPVLIEEVKPPLAFRMIESAKLTDWDGTLDHPEFDLLLEAVAGILGSCILETDEKKIVDKEEKEQKKLKTKDDETAQEKTTDENQKQSQTEKGVILLETSTNSIDMKFALIPAGEFMMGSEEIDWAKPVHKVTIIKPFHLGIYPVTQKEWNAVMKNNPSRFKGENLPVEQVSWSEVSEFITKLNEKEGAEKYRLPSEAEWEYAVRAGSTTRYHFGDDDSKLGEYAWHSGNSDGKTHPVGEKKPNLWGLYDMHGNVWEWVQDKWHENYKKAPEDGNSWESGDGSVRVFRGGCWGNYAGYCRSANRSFSDPGYRSYVLGFRLVRIL